MRSPIQSHVRSHLRYPNVSVAIIALLLVIGAARVAAQTSDVTPPMLIDFAFAPTAIDVTSSAQTVVVMARITDDLAGFTTLNATVFFANAGQGRAANFARVSGDMFDGIYVANVVFPRFIASGTWTVSNVRLFDLANNVTQISTAVLESREFPTELLVTSVPDLDPPTLAALNVLPAGVDVSAADQPISFTFNLMDAVSGVGLGPCTGGGGTVIPSFPVTLRSPSGAQNRFIARTGFTFLGGSVLNGNWRGIVTMPRYSEPGTWRIMSVVFQDCAGNTLTLTTAGLSALGLPTDILVASAPSDLTAPVLSGLSYSPVAINTSSAAQPVTIQVGVLDDLSGAAFSNTAPGVTFIESTVRFRSPSGGQLVGPSNTAFSLASGNVLNGTWQATANFPQFSEEGTWSIDRVMIKDAVRNIRSFNTAQLQALGFPTDLIVIRPSLVSDGTVGPSGGTVQDATFGTRASISFPSGALTGPTEVAIDVLANPLPVPNPIGFQGPGTPFVNVELTPTPAFPLAPPGMTIVLPLADPLPAGAALSLFKLDESTGMLVPALDVFGMLVVGFADADGLSATFTEVASLSTIVGLIPETINVAVDIRPGSLENSINLGSGGVLPVAVLSNAMFDARIIAVETVTLANTPVARRNNGRPMASFEDVNRDGLLDLVVHFTTQDLQILSDDTEATLNGLTTNGIQITGTDTVRIVR